MTTESVETTLSTCISKYLILALPGPTLEKAIGVTLNKERYAADFAPVVMENSAYSQFVLKVDFLQTRIKEWMSEMPEGQVNTRVLLERVFILLGKQASRNLVASIRLARLGNTLPKKKSERFSVNPKDQLKHALFAEEFCENRNYAETGLAFLAGLQYDLLMTAFTKAKASRDAMNGFVNHFPEAIRTAHFAYEIGSRMGSFPNSEYAFSAGLSLTLGRILAIALYPKDLGAASYAGFQAEIEKKNALKWMFADLEERRRFPVQPVELAAQAVWQLGFLRPIEPAIRFAKEPYLLKKTQPKLHALALLLRLADLTSSGRPVPDADLADLKAMRVKPEILTEASRAVSGKGKQ